MDGVGVLTRLDACEAVAREVESLGRRSLAVACHVGRWADLDALADRAYERSGKVDVLVNNAGSKAALNAINVAFAQEFAPNVRFNVISA